MSVRAKKTRVGELRPSQLLYTYGVGAIVDLPNIAAMVMGLSDWDGMRCTAISEPRLLAAVQEQLGTQVARLVTPPAPPAEEQGFMTTGLDESALIGVPVAPFPRYMRCPACSFLGPLDCGMFDFKNDPYRPDKARYVHANCRYAMGSRAPAVVPARFLTACVAGHLDDFPWVDFVHGGPTDCRASLELRDFGVSGEAAEVEVRCTVCEKSRRISEAFEEEDPGLEFVCRGRRPHLRDYSEKPCQVKRTKAILLGASNSWFGVTLSALSLPSNKDALAELVEKYWSVLKDADDKAVVGFLRKRGELTEFGKFSDAQIWTALEEKRHGSEEEPADVSDLKAPEWRVFADPNPARNTDDFRLKASASPPGFVKQIAQVVLAERVREVTALTGFTRIVSPFDFGDVTEIVADQCAPLARKPPTFVPAVEVRGEGIFLRFDEEHLRSFCEDDARDQMFLDAHRRWRRSKGKADLDQGYPGLRYVLLHSLSHILMRQLALECGYSAASIKERIYAREPGAEGGPMAGVLIYTAAPDSEGTLGGLVRLGEPLTLARHLEQALQLAKLCSSDPLCSEHHPSGEDLTLHGAACHACLFLPETCCERGNRYLCRTLLVETVTANGPAFFPRLLTEP